MTEGERRKIKMWSVERVNDLARGATGFAQVNEIVEAANKIYKWVLKND